MYIGNTPTQQAFTPAIDYFSGNASTTAFTLSRPVASVAQVQAVIENVPQNPGSAFTVSGNTITFTSAPPSGTNNIYVYYTSPITQVIQPGQGTVGTAQLINSSVTAQKLNSTTGSGSVVLASLPTFSTTMGVGGATAANTGSGITFPAAQSASSDANTLDDYEEGTWSPSLSGSISLGTGRYIKVGQLVYVEISAYNVNISSLNAATGWDIRGLPFAMTAYTYCMPCLHQGGSVFVVAAFERKE